MPGDDGVYWSIDFPGIGPERAQAIVDAAKRLDLATEGIIADPEVYMTLHLDLDTVVALERALTQASALRESDGVSLDSVLAALAEWRSRRE